MTDQDRVAALEAEVETLRAEVAALRGQFSYTPFPTMGAAGVPQTLVLNQGAENWPYYQSFGNTMGAAPCAAAQLQFFTPVG